MKNTQGNHSLPRSKRLWAVSALSLSLFILTLLGPSSAGASALEIVADESSVSAVTVSDQLVITTAANLAGNAGATFFDDGTPILIHYLDADISVTAKGETLQRLLSRMKIDPSPLDMVVIDQTGDMTEITVGSQFIFYDTVEEITPSPIRYVENNTLPTWSERVIEQGQDGVYREVYEVVYEEGAEVGRHLVDVVDTEATETVIERGTMDNFAPNDFEVSDITIGEDGTGTILLANGEVLTFNQTMTMTATAYTKGEPGVDGITASGTNVRIGTVAVDRKLIPFGTKMYIVTNDGAYLYGFSIAEDTGGSIKKNRIDLYFNSLEECKQFGRRECTVYILD